METRSFLPTRMETPETTESPAPLSIPATGTPGEIPLVSTGGSTEEQRRKWKQKAKLQRARKKAALNGSAPLAQNGAALPASASGASAVPSGDVSPPPIPWDPTRLRRLCEQIVPAWEKNSIEGLKAKAAEIDPCLVEIVEKEAPWNPVSKATVIETAPPVLAEILDACGIGAGRADAVALIMAVWCIQNGHATVANKLEKMAADKAAREEKPASK